MKLCSNPDEAILMLVDLRRDIDEFVKTIKVILDAPRRNKETLLPATIREFGRAVYAPLREMLPKYTELQSQMLLAHLSDPQLKQGDLLEQSRSLYSVAERCEGWILNAQTRARRIAGDASPPFSLPAVEALVTAVTGLISSHSRRIEMAFLSSEGFGQGVLSDTFPASLLLESTTSVLLDALRKVQEAEAKQEEVTAEPLSDMPVFLLEAETRQKLPAIRSEPWGFVAALRRVKDQLRGLGRAILRKPVDLQLDKIPQLPVWSNNDALSTDLPDFALSPQEYITEIGQYLMTLPQHLEMHISEKQAPWQFLSEVREVCLALKLQNTLLKIY
ncbi:hypothetical protein ACJJTC_012863 [Scirpophaga incertulas]